MKLAMLAVLDFCGSALGVAAIAAVIPAGRTPILNAGPHGLSEILYAATLAGRQQRLRLRRAHRQRHVLHHAPAA